MKILCEQNRFHGKPKKEKLENGRYTLRYQAIDDRKHPDEVKANGDAYPNLIEVFDGDELTYQRIYGIRDNHEHRTVLEMMRNEIKRGEHASTKTKQ